MLEYEIERVKHLFGNNQLGINLKASFFDHSGNGLLSLTAEQRGFIDDRVKELQLKYLYLEIETGQNLVEYNIRFYTSKEYCAHDQFLEEFRSDLAFLLKAINEKCSLQCSLNGKGFVENPSKKNEFVFLNKGDIVEYKIVKSTNVGTFCAARVHQIQLAVLILLCAGTIIWTIYSTYLLPDHNPERLLRKVIDV